MKDATTVQLTRIRLRTFSPSAGATFDLEALARLADVHPALVSEYVKLGLLDPAEERTAGDWSFDESSLYLLRKIQRLRNELGINLNGIGVVLELLRQVEELRGELARAAGRRP